MIEGLQSQRGDLMDQVQGAAAVAVDLSNLNISDPGTLKAVEARIRKAETERAALAQKLGRIDDEHKKQLARMQKVGACVCVCVCVGGGGQCSRGRRRSWLAARRLCCCCQ
jgi:hypothetical protein